MAQNYNDRTSDQERSIQKAKQSVNNIKKQYNKATKPIQDAKRQAKSYGKQQAKKVAKKAAKKVSNKAGEIAKKAGEKLAEAAKSVAQKAAQAIAKAAKAVGKAMVEALKGIGQAIASLGPYGWIVLAVIIVLVCCYGVAVYNSDKISKWVIGTQTLELDVFDSRYSDEAEALLAAIKSGGTIDITNEMPMMSREDLINILEHVVKYNSEMTTQLHVGVQYNEYETFLDPLISMNHWTYEELISQYETSAENAAYEGNAELQQTFVNKISELSALKNLGYYRDANIESGYNINISKSGIFNDITTSPMSYGQLAYLDVEGTEVDEYYNGVYDVDWRVILVLCEMMTEANAANYGTAATGWDESKQEALNTSDFFEASMDGYFISDEKIEALCQLLDYNIECYPDDLGYDYLQLAFHKLETGDTFQWKTELHIKPNNQNGINHLWYYDTEELPFAFLPEEVRQMTYTYLPTNDIYGNEVRTTSGVVYNNNGEWTYIGPLRTGYIFDGSDALIVDAEGNTAVKYINYDGCDIIANNDEMVNYRGFEDARIPCLAPKKISNVFFTAEYNYIDIPSTSEYYQAEAGAKMLDSITVTIDAQDFYNRISELIPNFSFEHFYELYSYFKVTIDEESDTTYAQEYKAITNEGIDKEVSRWKKMEDLYNKGKQAAEEYDASIASGVGIPIYSSREAALELSTIKVELDKTAMGAPTNGLIFVGTNSAYRAASGFTAGTTTYIWLGSARTGKTYGGFYEFDLAAKARIDKPDAYVGKLSEEEEKENIRKICQAYYDYMYDRGYELDDTSDFSFDLSGGNYTGEASMDRGIGGPFLSHFNSYRDTFFVYHEEGNGNITHSDELVEYLYEWQKEHDDVSLTAALAFLGTKAYMEKDPWMIRSHTYTNLNGYEVTPTRFGEIFNPTTGAERNFYSGYYSNLDEFWYYFEPLLNEIYTSIRKGQTSFYDMEFGHGFANTTVAQSAYVEEENMYTYGQKNGRNGWYENGLFKPWWEDELFPEQYQGGVVVSFNNNNIGWCNYAAQFRNSTLLKSVGLSCSAGTGFWPLETQLGETAYDAYPASIGSQPALRTTHISSPIGYRIMWSNAANAYVLRYHSGLDIACATGTGVYSLCNGTVLEVQWDGGYGNTGGGGYYIRIKGDDGYDYWFMHLTDESATVFVGQTVVAGQLIALSGNTGGSTGPHLHLQIRDTSNGWGDLIDPAVYLGIDEYNAYWWTHRVFWTEDETWRAWNSNTY